jgi:hypothetical protein
VFEVVSQSANPWWCLVVSTPYFVPALIAAAAHWSVSMLVGLKTPGEVGPEWPIARAARAGCCTPALVFEVPGVYSSAGSGYEMLIARLIGGAGLLERKLGPAHAGRAALFALCLPRLFRGVHRHGAA